MPVHTIPPVYDKNCRVLILGSFPSVKSREAAFFYAHPQNRFWRVLAGVFGVEPPKTVTKKKALLIERHIALWDVAAQCDISGSSDLSMKNVKPNNLTEILSAAPIEAVFVNGKTAEKYYRKLIYPKTGIEPFYLPSTSPANASIPFDKLLSVWKESLLKILNNS